MSEEALKNLLISINDSNNKSKSHIGMHNVQQRIKLFYGEKYGLSIESVEKQFTIVIYHLPLKIDDNALIKNGDGGFCHEIYDS